MRQKHKLRSNVFSILFLLTSKLTDILSEIRKEKLSEKASLKDELISWMELDFPPLFRPRGPFFPALLCRVFNRCTRNFFLSAIWFFAAIATAPRTLFLVCPHVSERK